MDRAAVGAFVGPCYAWWPGDPLPELSPLPGFVAGAADDDRVLIALCSLDAAEVAARRGDGNRPYLASVRGTPVAWGWVAERTLSIGELGVTTSLPPGNRYLWDFVTIVGWRGRGVYPRLLGAILRDEAARGTRCWIGHEPGNAASARGILKAGFQPVGDIHARSGGGYFLLPTGPIARAVVGAPIFGAVMQGQ